MLARESIGRAAPFAPRAVVASVADTSAPPQASGVDIASRLKLVRSASLPLLRAGVSGASGMFELRHASASPFVDDDDSGKGGADDTLRVVDIPTDWRLLTTLRVTSPWPLSLASTPCGSITRLTRRAAAASAPNGTQQPRASACGSVTAAAVLQQARVYWGFPDAPLSTAVLALKARQEPDVVAMCSQRLAQWVSCLRSAHHAVVEGAMECFFVLVRVHCLHDGSCDLSRACCFCFHVVSYPHFACGAPRAWPI